MVEQYDKTAILADQLRSAVFLVSLEDSFVAAHTIIMAAEELFRTIYVKKDLFVEFDYRFYIKDEYQVEYLHRMREKYNFFKHADRDLEEIVELDREQLHRLNEIMLALLIAGYRKTFSKTLPPFATYGRWFMITYPNMIRWDSMDLPNGTEMKAKLQALDLDAVARRQFLRGWLYHDGVLPVDDFDVIKLFRQMLPPPTQ